jgi:hypothetical protein
MHAEVLHRGAVAAVALPRALVRADGSPSDPRHPWNAGS